MGLFKSYRLADVVKVLPLAEIRKRAKIVVIDDDPDSFPYDILRNEGYTIEFWEKVKSLSRLENGDFDIIILDIGGLAAEYTKEDGLGVLEHIKKYNPSQIVVAFSGQTFDIGKTHFWKMSDDCLSKPVDAIKCKEVIDTLLQEKFTLKHYWEGLVSVLRTEGISDREIANLERKIAKAIKHGNKTEVETLIKSITDKGDIALKLANLGTKILTLCGLLPQ